MTIPVLSDKLAKPRRIIRRVVFSIIRVVILSYVGMIAFLFFFQSHYIYRPMKEIVIIPTAMRLPYEDVSFNAADGTRLSGWFIPAGNPKGAALFCHGNAGNISTNMDSVRIIHEIGLSLFIFDYRGYGKSEGSPDENGTYLDAEAAWDYLARKQNTPGKGVIVIGHSLGGAIAAWLARKRSPSLLIIESAFTSFPEIAAVHFPYLPAGLIARYKYNTIGCLQDVKCPVLIIHSPDDEIIPFQHGLRLFELAKKPKEFLEISGTHNEGFITSEKRYKDGLNAFISKYY